MASKGSYIIVGENIHCTRVRLTSGKFVADLGGGKMALVFKDGAETKHLPIPASFTESGDWKAGKVRHVAAAVQQGLYGAEADKEAGEKYVQAMAREQEAHGAWFLDLNVDEFSVDRAEKIKAIRWAAGVIQKVSTVPLSIDSSDPEILEAGLAACDRSKGKPMVNSVSLERASFIPLAGKAGACVIAGATGESKMPDTIEDRMTNIGELMEKLKSAGIALGDVYLDPLVYPASVDVKNSLMVIDSVKALRAKYGAQIHFAPGLSNISYGFPKRNVINQVFAKLCLEAGCDGGIVDPAQINDKVLAAVDYGVETFRLARELLLGNDEYGMNYISAFREGGA
jgi:5-methyltetrahydrofolate--homocysteine methyltransferase